MRKKSIRPHTRAQIVSLHDASLSQLQISNQLEVSWCCVQNAISKYKQLDQFDDLKHTERPKKLSDREIRHSKRLIKGDFRSSTSKIATDLNAILPELVITRTMRRYLKDPAFEYVVKTKVIQFCLDYVFRSCLCFLLVISWLDRLLGVSL